MNYMCMKTDEKGRQHLYKIYVHERAMEAVWNSVIFSVL